MEARERRCFFPLTSLQIGDLQSYLSRLTIFMAPESNKFLILVYYRPCLLGRDMRPAHLWQLMVTKSRLSPFANTKVKREKKGFVKRHDLKEQPKSNPNNTKIRHRWFSLIDAALRQKRALLPMKKLKDTLVLNSDLHHTLYGFIVFEVSWVHVRGINYLNELQTDTSMAVEAKLMKRWEFDSVQQASSSISFWYAGTCYERSLLLKYLNDASHKGDVFYDAQEGTSAISPLRAHVYGSDDDESVAHKHSHDGVASSDSNASLEYSESLMHTPPLISGACKRRKITRSTFISNEVDESSDEAYSEIASSPRQSVASTSSYSSDGESSVISEATLYRDVLILFRFNDHDLPFKLREIIMSDLRLLTLLEYGLPSWVIFLQSYPVFCHFYRPWMCPLARVLFVLISVTTVLIGFYDLYKNVPVLKVTASRLFGPLFDWIETWEMISRIKYLGTMLFLHNFEVAIKWFLMISRAIRSLLSVLTRPVAGPLEELVELLVPFWTVCLEMAGMLSSVSWTVIGSASSMVVSIVQIVLWPFWFVLLVTWSFATAVIYPICCVLWEILVSPARLIFASVNFMVMLCAHAYNTIRGIWSSMAPMFQLVPKSDITVGTNEVSMWRSLWNDLFSQVFRAVRSILYGFIAFFTTCNRHRLSIYNHLQELFLRCSYARRRLRPLDSGHALKKHRAETPLSQKGRAHGKNQQQSPGKARSRKNMKNKEVLID
uniref:Nucleotide exchange factor SIL1 n=1 Tax=Anthurium amnicola TaxID=1678845 RepID=A0A1D1YXH1_9ARAE